MGQIVIETPTRLKRRYQVDKNLASKLVEVLDSSGTRVDPSSLTAEDVTDIRAARRARKEESIDWKDAKSLLGL
jgi:predicted nucleic acid-binding protein